MLICSRPPVCCSVSAGNHQEVYHYTPFSSTMTSTCFARSRASLLRGNYNKRIARTCTTTSIPMHSSSSFILHTSSPLIVSAHSTTSEAPQRSEEWFALRRDKLTTSTFSTALGFWSYLKENRRSELWNEKVFAPETIAFEASARSAMDWGVSHEDAAIERYKNITGRDVGTLGFAVHREERLGWLGASPDGILECEPEGGILEVKCPYNKGKPELGLPWPGVPHYYMPQVQGLMEIMDRHWVDLYCWTPKGSAVFRIVRDREYWDLMLKVLQDFWWLNVIPAKELVQMRRSTDAIAYKPRPRHEHTALVVSKSKRLAAEARLLWREIGGYVEFYRQ